MKYLMMSIVCAGLLVGCATNTDTDTTSDGMGASGTTGDTTAGAATNSQGNARSPFDNNSSTGAQTTP